jgi:L-rhamnose isomerase
MTFESPTERDVSNAYEAAKAAYARVGVDTDNALKKLSAIPVSMNCWQADDVVGFEGQSQLSGGGIMATGNYPGRARTPDELRQDFIKATSLIPGTHRINLHASYLDAPGETVDRDEIETKHFQPWIDWAQEQGIGVDFNPTFFSHPKADDGFTLSSKDRGDREFWIEHGKRTRRIAADIGKALGTPCINNFWIPDGMKDQPADRLGYRQILVEALDDVFSEKLDPAHTLDAVESKLFGIASESYVVGSHEFYLAYALTREVMLCMDAGHYHPTEGIADKIPALLPFTDRLLLHVSRPVRWDSDHVVILDDQTVAVAREIAHADAFDKVAVAVDFFDASINRIAAWAVGLRSTVKAILTALLEPIDLLREAEEAGDYGRRLGIQESAKTLPFAAVWDKYCQDAGVPIGPAWLNDVAEYEKTVLSKRS